MNVALTIAGSDPSGGAGLQADLKTFHQHHVYGMSVVTLLTVQNTQSVTAVRVLEPEFVLAQLDAVTHDIPPQAAKTGAMGNAAVIEAIADRASRFAFPLIVDPVMISKHGAPLIDENAIAAFTRLLLPHAFLVTPNVPEAAQLTGFPVDDQSSMVKAAAALSDAGVEHVLIKGGHLVGEPCDLLWTADRAHWLPGERIRTRHTHGTGCVISAAITARIANGESVLDAVTAAKQFITAAIRTNHGLGNGYGPVNLHVPPSNGDLHN